jgi:hypothetical protein
MGTIFLTSILNKFIFAILANCRFDLGIGIHCNSFHRVTLL